MREQSEISYSEIREALKILGAIPDHEVVGRRAAKARRRAKSKVARASRRKNRC